MVQDNDFVGTCAVIPSDSSNNNNAPTRKVLTAAHKLKNIAAADLLKVRVGEWDASGFNAPEQQQHEEYTVVRILKHPDMSNTRYNSCSIVMRGPQFSSHRFLRTKLLEATITTLSL